MNDNKKYIIQFVFVLVGVIFIIKLFTIQVLDENYKVTAEKNIVQRKVEYPYRGLITDRNGKLIVYNSPVFDLMIVTKEAKNFDTVRFCNILKIKKEELYGYIKKMKEDRGYSSVKPCPLIKQLSVKDFATIQDHLVDFPGLSIVPRSVRSYPHNGMANSLGYIGEIDQNQLLRQKERDSIQYYKKGDYIGISGLESKYEKILRGQRGIKYKMVNVRGIEKGSFKKGAFDTLSVAGDNIMSTIDLELQKYGEMLLEGKVGSVVAIEPKTGEILSIISAPSYDPNLLTGRELAKNYGLLLKDPNKPLFNRPIMAMYPPGSIFKMIQALIGLQEKVLYPGTTFPCSKNLVNCHAHPNPVALHGAIQYSCNPYFWQTYKKIINQDVSSNTFVDTRIGLDKWKNYVMNFGLGKPLGVDLPNEKGGQIPGGNFYNKVYGEGRWKYSTIYSLSIGQGEMLVTPLQMANLAAIIANKGYYYTPHLVKSVGENGFVPEEYKVKNHSGIDSVHYNVVINAMRDALSGTATRAIIKDIAICGKTGTAQNPQGEDHSVFMAFAPMDDPKIAIAVYVENAGWGGRAAASTASLMIEKYLRGHITRPALEEYVIKGNFK
jgi:penicillin-binding protein 2